MAQDGKILIWLDMEMTGLLPDRDRIIELAVVITDSELNVMAESEVWAIHQTDEVLESMDEWNRKMHGKTGLTERARQSNLDEAAVEKACLSFLQPHVAKGKSPMCGNSICQDRRFMARYMPNLEAWFHYRNLDVSTLKELCKRWAPEIAKGISKNGRHEALADIHESIEEMRYYRANFLKVSSTR